MAIRAITGICRAMFRRRTMAIETHPFDVADYLETPEQMAAYLEVCLAENSDQSIAQALGTIARAKGMSELARRTGLTREALYRALSNEGNPNLSTLLKVCEALDLRLAVTAA
jgi:probable addiction module antidote protein